MLSAPFITRKEMEEVSGKYTHPYLQGNTNFLSFYLENNFPGLMYEVDKVEGISNKCRITFKIQTIKENKETGEFERPYLDHKGAIEFEVPSVEDIQELQRVLIGGKISCISRIYPSCFSPKMDKIVINDRIKGSGTCSHFFTIDCDAPFTIETEMI